MRSLPVFSEEIAARRVSDCSGAGVEHRIRPFLFFPAPERRQSNCGEEGSARLSGSAQRIYPAAPEACEACRHQLILTDRCPLQIAPALGGLIICTGFIQWIPSSESLPKATSILISHRSTLFELHFIHFIGEAIKVCNRVNLVASNKLNDMTVISLLNDFFTANASDYTQTMNLQSYILNSSQEGRAQ